MNTRRSPLDWSGSCAGSKHESLPLLAAFPASTVISGSNTTQRLCGAKRLLLQVERFADIGASPETIATTESIARGRNA